MGGSALEGHSPPDASNPHGTLCRIEGRAVDDLDGRREGDVLEQLESVEELRRDLVVQRTIGRISPVEAEAKNVARRPMHGIEREGDARSEVFLDES